MKTAHLLLLGGGLYVAWKFFEIKDAVSNLQYKVTGIDIKDLSATVSESKLKTTLSIFNPSEVNLKFDRFTGTIYHEGTPVATVAVSQPATIRANGITQIPMDLTIQNLEALPVADQILSGDLSSLNLKGTVTVSMIPIPVNTNLG